MKAPRKPWVMWLPEGLRDQQGWVFIGFMCTLSGVSHLIGFSEPTTITRVLDPLWLKIWGGVLTASGILIMTSVVRMNRPLEAFALRVLSVSCLVYMGWIVASVGVAKALFLVFLCLVLVVLAEIRVRVIKLLLKPLPQSAKKLMQ